MTFDNTNQQPQDDSFHWPVARAKVNLTELATAALESVGGDRDKAAALFLRNLRNENGVEYEYRVSVAMRAWAMSVMVKADSDRRSSITKYASCADVPDQPDTPQSRMTKPNQPLSIVSLRSVQKVVWFDWTVVPGVQLRNATRVDLNLAAQRYFRQSSAEARRANWLSAIAEKLKDDTTKVDAVLKEKDVAALAVKHKVATN